MAPDAAEAAPPVGLAGGGSLETIDGAGHLDQLEQTAAQLSLVTAFVD